MYDETDVVYDEIDDENETQSQSLIIEHDGHCQSVFPAAYFEIKAAFSGVLPLPGLEAPTGQKQ